MENRTIHKGDTIVVMTTKLPRKRDKSNSEYYAKNRRKGKVLRVKRSYSFRGKKAFEVKLDWQPIPKIYYEDEIVHIVDSPMRRYSVNQTGIIPIWRDSNGVKRCPDCGVELDESSRKVVCSKCKKTYSCRPYDRRRASTPAYKERRRLYCKEWRERKRAEGLCTRCGKREPEPGMVLCDICHLENAYNRNF